MLTTFKKFEASLDDFIQSYRELEYEETWQYSPIWEIAEHYDKRFEKIDKQLAKIRKSKHFELYRDLKALLLDPKSYQESIKTKRFEKVITSMFELTEALTKDDYQRISIIHQFLISKYDDVKILTEFKPLRNLTPFAKGLIVVTELLSQRYHDRLVPA